MDQRIWPRTEHDLFSPSSPSIWTDHRLGDRGFQISFCGSKSRVRHRPLAMLFLGTVWNCQMEQAISSLVPGETEVFSLSSSLPFHSLPFPPPPSPFISLLSPPFPSSSPLSSPSLPFPSFSYFLSYPSFILKLKTDSRAWHILGRLSAPLSCTPALEFCDHRWPCAKHIDSCPELKQQCMDTLILIFEFTPRW